MLAATGRLLTSLRPTDCAACRGHRRPRGGTSRSGARRIGQRQQVGCQWHRGARCWRQPVGVAARRFVGADRATCSVWKAACPLDSGAQDSRGVPRTRIAGARSAWEFCCRCLRWRRCGRSLARRSGRRGTRGANRATRPSPTFAGVHGARGTHGQPPAQRRRPAARQAALGRHPAWREGEQAAGHFGAACRGTVRGDNVYTVRWDNVYAARWESTVAPARP